MNKLLASMRIALRALRVNRMRSALTMLGIIIGVAAVIAMVAVGAGATARIQEQIQSIGSNLIIVLPGSISTQRRAAGLRRGGHADRGRRQGDRRRSARRSRWSRPPCAAAAQVVLRKQQLGHVHTGRDAGLHDDPRPHHAVRPVLHRRRMWMRRAKVAVLGETVATNLFGDGDPVGQIIRIKNVPFTVVGVLTPKGQSPTGQDQDDVILLPISTAKQKVLGRQQGQCEGRWDR